MQRYYLETACTDPWHNLALEEYLFDRLQPGDAILYIWQNQNTVVIGKNQNAWKECRHELLEREGGKLARRSSGGGAVFHDLGNLCFTFVMSKELYDVETQLGVVLGALRNLGIDAVFSGRNDLTVDGQKFSGNAFCHRKQGAVHHGTLLVDVDYGKMTRYLAVSPDKIQSKGIDSVRSRVVNLTEKRADLTMGMLKEALRASFEAVYDGPCQQLAEPGNGELRPLYEKYASWDWRFGQSPTFDMVLEQRFPWGGVELCLSSREGLVTGCKLYSDAMDEAFIEAVAAALPGTAFRSAALAERVRGLGEANPQVAGDLAAWLLDKGI